MINMQKIDFPIFIFFLFSMLMFTSCETEFIPEGTNLEIEVVVEGFIESGTSAGLPYVFITKSVPFFDEFDPNEIENLFVHNADVSVFDGSQNWPFEEVCLNDVPDALRPIIAERFGFNPDSTLINVCVYIDLSFSLQGSPGATYNLNIILEDDRELTATTTIPPHTPVDSFWFVKPSDIAVDTLLELRGLISDVGNRADFYRYFTAVNSEGIQAPFQSVTDDAFFDGQSFEFPLANAAPVRGESSFETFGLFNAQDTATVKWTNIDEPHYEFWSTLEFNRASQGPFSSYTQIATNIEGGLGIWGGYAVSQYEIIVQE